MPGLRKKPLKNGRNAAHSVLPFPIEFRSIKVKRLFLFLAAHFGRPWTKRLEISGLDLGSTKQAASPGSVRCEIAFGK